MAARRPHGGGAFSGKDPTKVDRSAAYAARYLAKNIVAAGLARRCTIQLAYAIGVSEPLSLYVDTHGTGTVGDDEIEAAIGRIDKLGRLTPRGIRTHLGLNKPIYEATAAYGHFGRKPEGDLFPWERLDLVEDLKAAVARLTSSAVEACVVHADAVAEDEVAALPAAVEQDQHDDRRRYRRRSTPIERRRCCSRSTRLTSSSTTAVTLASMCFIASLDRWMRSSPKKSVSPATAASAAITRPMRAAARCRRPARVVSLRDRRCRSRRCQDEADDRKRDQHRVDRMTADLRGAARMFVGAFVESPWLSLLSLPGVNARR